MTMMAAHPWLAYWRLLRPRQWIKNGFVLVGLLFGHAWADGHLIGAALLAIAAFSLASSAVYVINDYVDRDADKFHPEKCRRPIASGAVPPGAAVPLATLCAALALSIAGWVSGALALIVVAYLVLNVAYSFALKRVPVLDVFCIALGFVLRIFAGTVGLGIVPSTWLVLCGMLVTLFLGFAKRRAEVATLATAAAAHRSVLDHYRVGQLDHLVTLTAGASLVAYALYTVSPHVIVLHGTADLVYSVPFAMYGILRFLARVLADRTTGDPVTDVLRDKHIVGAVLGWIGAVLWVLS